MKYYHFVYILVIVALVTTIFNLFSNNRKSELHLKFCTDQNLKMDGFYRFLKFKDKETIMNNGAALSPNLILFDESNNSVQLSHLVKSNNYSAKLVIRFSAIACDICLDEEVKILNDYISNIGIENIMIFASNYNIRSLIVKKNNLSISLPFYRIEEMDIQFEKNNTNLFVFMIDKDFTVKDFFIPEKTLPELSKDYYSTIISKYWK